MNSPLADSLFALNKITFKTGMKQFLEILSTSSSFPLLEELISNNEQSPYLSFNELLKKVLSYSTTIIKQCKSPDIVYIKMISQLLEIQTKRKISFRTNYNYIISFVCLYLQTPIPDNFKTNNINTIITIIQCIYTQIENVNLENGSFADMQTIKAKVKEEKSLILSSYLQYCSETLQTFNLSILEGETVLNYLLVNAESIQPSIVLDVFDILTSNINTLNTKKNFMNKLWLSVFEAFLLCLKKTWLQLSLESLMSIIRFSNETFRSLIEREVKERDFDIILLKYVKVLRVINEYNFFRKQYSRDFKYHFLLVILKECLENAEKENIDILVDYFKNVYKHTLPQISTESTNQVLVLDFLQVYFKENKLLKVNFKKLHSQFFTFLLSLYKNKTVQRINRKVHFDEKSVFENLTFYLELEKEKGHKETVLKCVLVQLENCNIRSKTINKEILDKILTNLNFNDLDVGCTKDKINLLALVITKSNIQNFSISYIERIIDKITAKKTIIQRNKEIVQAITYFLKILSNHFFNFKIYISLTELIKSFSKNELATTETTEAIQPQTDEVLHELLNNCITSIDDTKLDTIKSTQLTKEQLLLLSSHFKTNTGNSTHFDNVCRIIAEIICSQLDVYTSNNKTHVHTAELKELTETIIESNQIEAFKFIFNKCHELEKFKIIDAIDIFFKSIKPQRPPAYRNYMFSNMDVFFEGYKNKKQVLDFIFNRFSGSKDKTNTMYNNFKTLVVNIFKVKSFNKFILFKEVMQLAAKKIEIRNDVLIAFAELKIISKEDSFDVFDVIKYNEEDFVNDLKNRMCNVEYLLLLSKFY